MSIMSKTGKRGTDTVRFVKSCYGCVCAAASAMAIWGLWNMAVECPEYAAVVAACVAVVALARGDMILRFGQSRRNHRDR